MDSTFLDDYICGRCSAAGVKLWRPRGSSPVLGLLCLSCVEEKAGKKIEPNTFAPWGAHYVPAVPCEDGYWGYTSVPQVDVDWWEALPTVDQAREARKRKILINAMAHADILSPEQLVEFDGFEAERLKIEDEREARMTFAVAGEIEDKKL